MAATDIRKNFTLAVDGRGYAGKVSEFTPPKLTQVTEDFRAGGMNGTLKLNMGMEAMDADFTLLSYDRNVLALFGLVDGGQFQITAREVLESYDGTITAVVHNMRGKITEMDSGTSKSGPSDPLKVTVALSYYKLTHGGRVTQEIDIENMIHFVNGVDVLAQQRAALGM